MMKAPHWLSHCMCDGKGKTAPDRGQCAFALRNDDGTRDAIAYDEMYAGPMLLHQIGQPIGGDCREPRALTDKDSPICRRMQLAGLTTSATTMCACAVDAMRAITVIIPCSTISRACDGMARHGSTLG